ncbi:hypothetical protein F4777DRAFT_568129 [Nemania sp. FL0916]|nr:hypothetical protein F4777DRAFT_568129 [Nemania sp. FL0916]
MARWFQHTRTRWRALQPFSASTTKLQAATYLLGISLFSISFLVFLNSAVSFVVTDLLGVKHGVGDVAGTLGFADELVALVACPLWGLLSDRVGVRNVAVLGYAVIALSLVVFVQCRSVYPALVLARILFAVGATAAATMVTAALPVLTGDSSVEEEGEGEGDANANAKNTPLHRPRGSIAVSLASDVTITPARFNESSSSSSSRAPDARRGSSASQNESQSDPDRVAADDARGRKPSALAGLVGLFTGCGALVALALFLPLPAYFSSKEGVTPAQAITDSFYVVAAVALAVAVFVFFGLRGLKGEEEKGWMMLFDLKSRHNSDSSLSSSTAADSSAAVERDDANNDDDDDENRKKPTSATAQRPLPYQHLLLSALRLGAADADIGLGYLGGFVARASTVAISLFVPLYVNAYFMSHGFCAGSPNDPSPDLKRECRAAYVLAASLSGAAQLVALLCAPVFGFTASSARRSGSRSGSGCSGGWGVGGGINWGVIVAAALGVVGYIVFPQLASPEFRDVDGRGGSPAVFLVVALLGVSQIGAIVCSLGSLGRGVLGEDVVLVAGKSSSAGAADAERGVEEDEPLLSNGNGEGHDGDAGGKKVVKISRVQLKGSVAGVYSWCGGAAILLLTKLGGYLFDALSTGAPFYMMAAFNAALLVASLAVDLRALWRRGQSRGDI